MDDPREPSVQLGQLVRRRDRSRGAEWGIVVGVVFTLPLQALVRWPGDKYVTFELVDGLIDAVQALMM